MSAPDFGDQIESEKLSEIKLSLKVSKSQKKYVVLDSPKKRTLGHFSVHKHAPAFVSLENLGQHNFFSRFTDL